MRRALILTTALAAGLFAASGSAMAQEQRPGEAAGLRYMGWSGRTTDTAPRGRQTAEAAGLRRPAAVIPHAGAGPPPVTRASATSLRTPERVQRSGLTPASDWLSPAGTAPTAPVAPPPQPQPEYLPEPARPQPTRPAPTPPAPEMRRETPPPASVQPQPEPPPMVPEFDPADPMAPRRDAPIFRMLQQQGQAPQPMPQQQAAAQTPQQPQRPQQPVQQLAQVNTGQPTQTARYYSVHRPTGRQPDPVVLPDQVTLEALQLTDLPAGTDLAEPQPGPTLMRNADGRMVPVPDQDEQ